MAGKTKGKDKALDLKVRANTEGADKPIKELTKAVEKTVANVVKLNEALETTTKKVKAVAKLNNDAVKNTNKLLDEKTKAEQKAAKDAERAAEKEYKAKLKFAQDVRREQRRIENNIAKDEKDRARKQEQDRKNYIAGIKKSITELNQEMSKLRTTGYGAIVNAFTTALPARIGTAAAYKTIGMAMDAVRDSFGSLAELQQQFAAIYAITDTTSASMERLRGTILQVGSASMYSTEQLAQATIILGQAGLSAEQIVDALEAVNNLAVGTGTDLAMSVNVLTSSLAVWNKEASQAGHVSDVLVKAANETKADVGTMANAIQYAGAAASDLGVSFEEFTAVASAVTNAGLKARSVVGTGFRSVLTELINPSAKLRKVFEMLGVSLEDVDVRSRGLTSVLRTLRDAGLDASMAFQGFDRRAASFFIAATSQLDTVDKLRNAFLEEGAAAKAAGRQMDTFSAQWERLKNAMKAAFSDAFRPFLEILTQLVKLIAYLTGSKIGKFVAEVLALKVAFSSTVAVAKGLVNAYKLMRDTSMKLIAATVALRAVEGDTATAMVGTSKATFGLIANLKILWTAMRTGIAVGTALKAVLVSLGAMLIIPALIAGITALISNIKSAEEAIDEANDKIKESENRVSSLEDAYDELIKKQKMYREDQYALITRGREINKQFELQGTLALRAADSLEEYLGKLQLVILSEKEKQRIEKKKVIDELKNEVFEPGLYSPISGEMLREITGQKTKFNSALYLSSLAAKGNEGLAQLTDLREKAKGVINKYYPKGDDEEKYNKVLELYDQYINKVVELQSAKEDFWRLGSEIKAFPETAKTLRELAISLGDMSDKWHDDLELALNADTFEEMTTALSYLTKAIEAETAEEEKNLRTKIKEAEDVKNESGARSLRNMLNDLLLKREEALSGVTKQREEVLSKRVNSAARDYQNFTKAIKEGNAGMPPEEASKKLEELRERLKSAIEIQKQYELDVLRASQDKKRRALLKEIEQYEKNPNSIPNYVTDRDAYIKVRKSQLERLGKQDALTVEAIKAIDEKYDNLYEERMSRAVNADIKNTKRSGKPSATKIPYTWSLYEDAYQENPEAITKKMRELEEKYQNATLFGSGGLGRGSLLYGQKLAPEVKDFMDDTWAQSALKGIETFTDGFTDAVTQFANSSKDFQTALRDFASETLKTIGNWLIQMSIKAAIVQGLKMMFPEFFSAEGGAGAASAPAKPKAAGGLVRGGTAGRDSVRTKLMPGEYVLKKSAVDYLGENFLNGLNANASQTMNAVSGDIIASDDSPASVVNVWVVAEEDQAGMGPNDVIATITKDIRNGGQTRQLIKSIVAGRK